MAFLAPFMLATGDYGGRICVWNIFTGERRCTLTHDARQYQRGVEQLLFLRPHDPHASPILLSFGGVSCNISPIRAIEPNRPENTRCLYPGISSTGMRV